MPRDYRNNSNRNNEDYTKVINEINNLKQLSDLNTKDYADEGGYADIIAKNSSNLKTNQLRKFFAAVRLIEQKEKWEDIESGFYLLKPKLAVAVGRGNVPKNFYKLMMTMMRKVDVNVSDEDKLKNFKVFVNFFESIVAYHKYYHPKN